VPAPHRSHTSAAGIVIPFGCGYVLGEMLPDSVLPDPNRRLPGSKEWERLDKNLSYNWKDNLLPILRTYQQTTPGTFIEEKHSSLVWQ
jgi:hypothetical protein